MLLAALGGPLLVAAAAVFTLLLPDAAEIAPSLRLQLIAVTVGGMVLAALIMLWIVGLFRRDLARLEGAARERLQRAEAALGESEARYARVVEGTEDGVFDWDFLRDRDYISARLKTMLGFSEGGLPERREIFRELIHPEDRARVEAVQRLHVDAGEPFVVEHRLRRTDGGYLWVRARGAAMRAPDGRVARLCGTITDISAERAVNDRVAVLLEQQRAVFDNAVAGIVRLRRGVIVSCNRRFAEMLGHTAGELAGRAIEALAGDATPSRAARALLDAPGDGGTMQQELLMRRADGGQSWFLVSGSHADPALPDSDTVWVMVDIDDSKRTELALRENEARLYHAIKGSSDAIWDWDLRNNRYYMSPRMCEFLGEGYGEPVTDRAWYESRMHPADRARVAEAVRCHLEDGEPYVIEYRLRAIDGGVRWIRSRGQAVRDAEGRAVRFSGANTDITEARAAADRESALRAEQQAVFGNDLVGIVRLRERVIVSCNARFAAIFGHLREALIGRSIAMLYPGPEAFTAASDAYATIRATGSYRAEHAYRHASGRLVWCAEFGHAFDRIAPERDSLWMFSDIDERKRAELEVRAANQRLEERVTERTTELVRANRALEAFSYTVSHDLSAPLRAIDGFGALLEEEAGARLSPAAGTHLARIRASARQMKALIDDLLRLARVSREALERRDIDLATIARRVAGELAARDPSRRVAFIVPPSLPAHGDERLLEIALTNLLGNAWKFTGRVAHARIELGRDVIDGETTWFVRDNGAGLDMHYAERLFKPFQRLHAAREFEGTGIGLAIVHSIIERHGGKNRVESAPGEGATFHFTLG